VIDTKALLELLPSRRWFGRKSRTIQSIGVVDEAILHDGPPALVFCIAAVAFADAAMDLYSLPLLVDPDGTTRDALDEAERLGLLGELMTHGETFKGTSGVFHFGGPGLDPLAPPGARTRRVAAEQSNSSVVLDNSVIVKLFRRVQSGPNPDLELSRLLTSEGFESIPPHVGEILYEGEIDGEKVEIDLGVAQQYVRDGRDGWAETLAGVRALLDEAHGSGDDPDDVVTPAAAKSLDELARLGEVVASLHVVLAREELEPDVVAEPVTQHDVKGWVQRVRNQLDAVVAAGALELEGNRDAIEARLEELTALDDVGLKTRVHGDLHLGQVMLAPRGWLILDFEGEPARPLSERRAKQSPLLDVAGMLRSFDYAGCAALFERSRPGSHEWTKDERWVDAWQSHARQRFLNEYLRTSHEGGFLPSERSAQAAILEVFEIDKALYEIAYELDHRPEWAHIPRRGLEQILSRTGSR
jgi:trehalose synthase-fused probable maltokinase